MASGDVFGKIVFTDWSRVLAEVVAALVCPVCREPLGSVGAALRCRAGHCFDLARQGYANLLAGSGSAAARAADDSVAVAARVEFPDCGSLCTAGCGNLSATVADSWPGEVWSWTPDPGRGTSCAAVLDASAGGMWAGRGLLGRGVAARGSGASARRGDRLGPAPNRGRCVTGRRGVLNVFAPRNAAEYARVLRRDGRLLVVVPGPGSPGRTGGRARADRCGCREAGQIGRDVGPVVRVGRRESRRVRDRADPGSGARRGGAWGPTPGTVGAASSPGGWRGLPELNVVRVDAGPEAYRPR